MNIQKNDPKLTSFVLNELSENERIEIQTALETDIELRAEVEAIRKVVAQVEEVMKNEPINGTGASMSKQVDQPKRSSAFVKLLLAVAALCLVVVTLGFLISEFKGFSPEAHREVSFLLDSTAKDEYSLPVESFSQKDSEQIGVVRDEKSTTAETLGVLANPMAERQLQRGSVSGQTLAVQDNAPADTLASVDKDRASEAKIVSNTSGTSNRNETAAGQPMSGPVPVPRPMGRAGSAGGGGAAGRPGVMASAPTQSSHGFMAGPPAPMGMAAPASNLSGGIMFMEQESVAQFAMADRSFEVEKQVADDAFLGRPLIRPHVPVQPDTEAYKSFVENEFLRPKDAEFSTFSIDVDSASYTTMRRYIQQGQRPPAVSVRLEEYVNYFKYAYKTPTDGKPFATSVDVAPCPWEPKHFLARIAIKGKEFDTETPGSERPPLNLVFLIDVSGSMSGSNRLPLVQRGLTELVEMLQPQDRVAIVTYAGDSRVALPSVSGQEKQAILDSINGLNAGGSTAGAQGIQTAYETARKYYRAEAQNRVVLCTDGDFNVGVTDNTTLETMIGNEAKSGIYLTILGFGMGNYKDDRLKTLSMRGNGNYGYIDTIEEARRLLVAGLTGTLIAIAKDVKIQVDFNPRRVAGYRLLGYENRKLRAEDFNNDKVDAGEVGAGHTVTALYEIVPVGVDFPAKIDRSRYAEPEKVDSDEEKKLTSTDEANSELLFVKVRYKEPDSEKSALLTYPVVYGGEQESAMSSDSQFAAAVALYGMLLRSSNHSGSGTWDMVLELASPNLGEDSYRKEFIDLVKKAKELTSRHVEDDSYRHQFKNPR